MKKEWLVKTLALGVVVLFIGVSCSSAVSVDTKTSIINNQKEENKLYVDPNIHLSKSNLPILKRSFKYFKNSNQYDAEIGKVMEQIIKLIEFKGEVNSEDVENILKNNGIEQVDTYTFCKIKGHAYLGYAAVFPLYFIEILSLYIFVFFSRYIFIGIGGFLHWGAEYPYYGWPDIEIKVGSTIYTGEHQGYGFGFCGLGHIKYLLLSYYPTNRLYIRGNALIVFVRT